MVSIDDRLNQIIRELIASGITLKQAVEAFEGKYIVVAKNMSRRLEKRGPHHRRSHHNPVENELISTSDKIWDKPRGKYIGDMSVSLRPAKFGPYHRRSQHNPRRMS